MRTPEGSKRWNPPKNDPITTLENFGDYREVPFLGSCKVSGKPCASEEIRSAFSGDYKFERVTHGALPKSGVPF